MSNHASQPTDPLIEEQIERTLRRYRGIATPAMLETMRRELFEMLTTHPVAVGMLNKLRDRPAPLVSGDRPIEGVEPEADRKEGT